MGVPRKTPLWQSEVMSLAPDTFHEFEVPPNCDEKGVLTVSFLNANDTALLFPLEDGLEVLYRQGGFGLNFVRGLGIILSEGTLMGFNSETSRMGHSVIDVVAIPVFRAVLEVINLAKNFSPIDSLSTGRSVSWGELGQAFGQIVVLLGGSVGLIGIIIFSRRELATAQLQ